MKRSAQEMIGVTLVACFVTFAAVPQGRPDEKTDAEELPPPKLLEEERGTGETHPFSPYFRTSRYEVWQYYGVDRFGRFRPRVILSPHGAYYLYNGQPYPWVTTHAADFMLRVVD